jgi:hypothetical protein
VNGEAIYDTHKWRESFQWSAGAREGLKKGKYYVSGDAILAQTVCPEKGQAVKEAFFTQSVKGGCVCHPARLEKREVRVEKHTIY